MGTTRLTRAGLTHSHFIGPLKSSASLPQRSRLRPLKVSRLSPPALASAPFPGRCRSITDSVRPYSTHFHSISTAARPLNTLRIASRTCPSRSFNPAIHTRFEARRLVSNMSGTPNMEEKKWTGLKVRQTFFDFFAARGHTIGKSSTESPPPPGRASRPGPKLTVPPSALVVRGAS